MLSLRLDLASIMRYYVVSFSNVNSKDDFDFKIEIASMSLFEYSENLKCEKRAAV